jgi:glutamate--cysteine ligase
MTDASLINTIADYLVNNCKNTGEERSGVEIEHFVTRPESGKSVTYFEPDGVGNLLETLGRDNSSGWEVRYESRYPLSLSRMSERGEQTVTLEPGAQLEYSSSPCRTVSEIEAEYGTFLDEVTPVLAAREQTLETWGYQPVDTSRKIPFIPKKKYHYMAKYFLDKGKLAHHMMKGTAATQVTIDYFDEADFTAKLRLATALSPVFAVLFSNCPVFEGNQYSGWAVRLTVWDNCDSHRCGLLPGVFDSGFGFEQFASWFSELKPIVFYEDGKYRYTGEKGLRTIFEQHTGAGQTAPLEEALRMVFTDVRVKQFLELRMTDALPKQRMLQYAALVNELFYNRDLFGETAEYFRRFNENDILESRAEAPAHGPEAPMGDETIGSVTKELLQKTERYCSEENRPYLQPLFTGTTSPTASQSGSFHNPKTTRARCGTC